MLNVGGGELVLLILAALIILGPSRLPHYAAKLAQAVRTLRDLADGAKAQIKNEMGPAFEDVDWRQLDPRQYDPRRIVREALVRPSAPAANSSIVPRPDDEDVATLVGPLIAHDPMSPTPFDVEAT